jgi:hypothetical protein
MNKLLTLIFFFIFLSGFQQKASATHAVGAELRYESLGGNSYRFFFKFYRDCVGIAVANQYNFMGSSSCGNSINFVVNLDSIAEVSHVCSTAVSNCINFNSPFMGIEEYFFHGDVTLPFVCTDWTFGLAPAICNRNAAITNLNNPSTFCLYVNARLDNVNFATNNSPAFLERPVFFLCANQVQYVQNYGYDIDGDSVVFQMITPHSDAVSDVQYVAGLSGTQPVTYTSAADSTQFNTATGSIRFNANFNQITVIAVEVSEYRNGMIVGTMERDIQVIFENCTNWPPASTGINGTGVFEAHICADSSLNFQIFTSDFNNDSTTISAVNNIPGSVFITNQGSLFQTGYFGWQPPGISSASPVPYTFSITVTDNSCPVTASNGYLFQIYVDSCYAVTGIPAVERPAEEFTAFYSSAMQAIRFQHKMLTEQSATLTLYDLTGRKIRSTFVDKAKAAGGEIEANGIARGIYILRLQSVNGVSKSVKVAVE